MNKIRVISIIILFLANISLTGQGLEIKFRQTNEAGIYKKGQNISVVANTANFIGDSLHIRILKNNKDVLLK